MRIAIGRGEDLFAYFAWAVEQHPATSWVLAEAEATLRSPFADPRRSNVLLANAVFGVARETAATEGIDDVTQTLREPEQFWGADDKPELSPDQQDSRYYSMLGGFLAVLAGSEAGASLLLVSAIRGSINQRLTISGFLSEATRGEIGVARALPTPSDMRRWGVRASSIPSLPNRSEDLSVVYLRRLQQNLDPPL